MSAPPGWHQLRMTHGPLGVRPLLSSDRRAWTEQRARNRWWLQEWEATLPPESRSVEIRGRLTDDVLRAAVHSFARAQFGSGNVYLATLNDPTLPDGWPVRVLAGLEALGQLHHGSLLVRADTVEVRGVTGSQTGKARISQILSDKLGQGKTFKVDVTYDEALDPLAALPTPEECAQDVMATLWQKAHLFDPTRASVATWVFTIARNRRIDAARKARRPEPEDLPWGPEDEPDQADLYEAAQETRKLGQALAELPEKQRALIQRAFYGDLSHSEIAAETGLPLGTIKSRIRLALERLRQKMT